MRVMHEHDESNAGRSAGKRVAASRWSALIAGLARPAQVERSLLAVFLVAAALVWGFVELADEVIEGGTREFDRALLLAFRADTDAHEPLGPPWLREMARDFTALGGVGVLSLVTASVIGYLLLVGKKHAALAVLAAIAGGRLLGVLLKFGFDRPRPDLVPYEALAYGSSFPSGHSMMAAVTYLTLAVTLARVHRDVGIKAYLLATAMLLTVLVGVSRVYLGVHWPSDVLGGWTVGAAWALLCWLAMRWLQRRGTVEPPSG